ncbi:MAG: tetratricopeptide repeat protein [Deltaproteobacteria bacterium]|nr:tetratricopeptide repeat protein [Deltaproteobacteria bacterium]
MKGIETFCFFSLFLLLSSPLGAQEKGSKELFAQAYARYTQKDFAGAEPLLLQTLNRDSPFEDYSLYFLGEIALARPDPESARQRFSQTAQRFPQSVWALPAHLQLAKIMLSAKDYAGAGEKLNDILNRSGSREVSAEARLLLARLHELQGEPAEAHALYQELRQISPQSPWAAKAREEVQRLRRSHPKQFGLTTAEALAGEARLLHKERQFDEAEKTYRRALAQVPRGQQRVRVLSGLARVYLDGRRREEAIAVLSEIVRDYEDAPEAPEALDRLARIYWFRDENLKARELFTRLQERYPQNGFNDSAHFALARIHESLSEPDPAQRLYQSFEQKYPQSSLLEEVAWRLGWLLYIKGDYPGAHGVFRRLAQNTRATRYKTAALYWQGRTAERLGRAEEAKQIALRIVRSPEESYYTGLAAKRLERLGAAQPETTRQIGKMDPPQAPSLDPVGSFHLTRARALGELSLHELAVRELDALALQVGSGPEGKLFLMHEYARSKAYAQSAAIANQFPESAEGLSRYRYPLAYWEPIQKIAGASALDPYLVVALIRQESMFDPKAVSPASAYGLMQLLPSTAARVARRFSVDSVTAQRLFEPELNLRLGSLHLKELLEQFPESLPKAIAAYNAGKNAVERWEKEIAAPDEEEFVERIPYGETRLYVNLVLRNYRIYARLYSSHR